MHVVKHKTLVLRGSSWYHLKKKVSFVDTGAAAAAGTPLLPSATTVVNNDFRNISNENRIKQHTLTQQTRDKGCTCTA